MEDLLRPDVKPILRYPGSRGGFGLREQRGTHSSIAYLCSLVRAMPTMFSDDTARNRRTATAMAINIATDPPDGMNQVLTAQILPSLDAAHTIIETLRSDYPLVLDDVLPIFDPETHDDIKE